MTGERWHFSIGEQGLELGHPDGVDPAADVALWDLATSDIGISRRHLSWYREAWETAAADPASASEGISGNSTSQRVENGVVVLEALYDQWPAVRLSRAQFEAFLDQYADFLNELEQR